jgi:oligosaccharyltransferase complex subunit beta
MFVFFFVQVFNVQFDEFVHGKWMPFNGTDVQLEFVRIDPFVRTTMKNKGRNIDQLIFF